MCGCVGDVWVGDVMVWDDGNICDCVFVGGEWGVVCLEVVRVGMFVLWCGLCGVFVGVGGCGVGVVMVMWNDVWVWEGMKDWLWFVFLYVCRWEDV